LLDEAAAQADRVSPVWFTTLSRERLMDQFVEVRSWSHSGSAGDGEEGLAAARGGRGRPLLDDRAADSGGSGSTLSLACVTGLVYSVPDVRRATWRERKTALTIEPPRLAGSELVEVAG
jgi:hypothetical protein